MLFILQQLAVAFQLSWVVYLASYLIFIRKLLTMWLINAECSEKRQKN